MINSILTCVLLILNKILQLLDNTVFSLTRLTLPFDAYALVFDFINY